MDGRRARPMKQFQTRKQDDHYNQTGCLDAYHFFISTLFKIEILTLQLTWLTLTSFSSF